MKYAQIDPTQQAAHQVLGFFLVEDEADPEGFSYPNLPAAAALVKMTDAQWTARFTDNWYDPAAKSFVAPDPSAPTLAQQAQAALAAGCQIVSTSTATLSGTYACDPAAQSKIQATALYIQVNGKFPAGKPSLPWADAGGTVRTFGTTAEFLAFATAIGDYVTELEMVVLGEATVLPAQPVTIA